MLRYLPILVAVMLAIYAVTDMAQTEAERVNYMPKWMWFVLIVLVPIIGPVIWLLFGRRRSGGGGGGGWDPRDSAPDNDPEFLRKL